MNRRKMPMYAFLVLLMPFFVSSAGCCPGKGKDKPGAIGTKEGGKEAAAKVGETVQVGETQFQVIEVLKKDALSHFSTGETRKADGFFVQIHGSVTNKGGKPKRIENPLVMIDSENRKYESMTLQDDYLPDAYLSLWSINLEPRQSAKWGAIFEVRKEAGGLKLEMKDLGVKSGQKTVMVDLGI